MNRYWDCYGTDKMFVPFYKNRYPRCNRKRLSFGRYYSNYFHGSKFDDSNRNDSNVYYYMRNKCVRVDSVYCFYYGSHV